MFSLSAGKRLRHDLDTSDELTRTELKQDGGQYPAYVSYENMDTNTNLPIFLPQRQLDLNSSPKTPKPHRREPKIQRAYVRNEKPFKPADYIGKIDCFSKLKTPIVI